MENKQKVIFLIRHGNTEFNEKKLFRGHLDVPLDSAGIGQAKKTGEFLKDINLDLIFSSPLSRAYGTAETIKKYQANGNNIEIIKEDGFMDLNFGDWEGKGYDEAKELYPKIFNQWIMEPFRATIPGGETLYDAQDRSWETLKKIVEADTGTFLAIVTHRVINKLLILKMLDIGESAIWRINQDPCCINIFEYKYGTFFVSKLNYNFHITDIKESFFKLD
ncbi:MAG: histidine phosphatase family protein [Actinobacteria bacterium]|nr:histidine phosphatase family protein [Actinomycetota bacterium]